MKKKRKINEKTKTMERKGGVGVEKRESRRRIRKKRVSDKKRERKEGENYKTENEGKLEMKERSKEKILAL